MKLVIDRGKWYRGLGGGSSRLRRRDGMQCCLGFLGAACEVPEKGLLDVEYPVPPRVSQITNRASDKWPSWLFDSAGARGKKMGAFDVASHLAIVNDREGLADREEALREIFAEHGVEVEFVG